jgi:hypothetical protein
MGTNPYESPHVAMEDQVSPSLRKKARLLLARKEDISGAWIYFKMQWKRQVLFILIYLFGLFIVWVAGLQYAAVALGGFVIGTKLRDIRWWRALARDWQDTRQILDWEKITALANGHDVPEQAVDSEAMSE